ncbi:hypothetical protein WA171_002550, partial [Blastocystis sp. BT1]
MFNRFLGTAKPVEKKEDKPVDMSRITEHMSRLDQREERIQKKIQDLDTQLEQIKQKLATASGSTYQSLRVQASNIIRQKNMYLNQLKSVTNMNLTMGQTAATIENAQMMKEQFDVMKEVSSAQSQMFQSINLNEFMTLNDKMQDMREDMEDVQEMMMDGMMVDNDIDEEELDRELADIHMNGMPVSGNAMPTPAFPDPTAATVPTPAMQSYNFN